METDNNLISTATGFVLKVPAHWGRTFGGVLFFSIGAAIFLGGGIMTLVQGSPIRAMITDFAFIVGFICAGLAGHKLYWLSSSATFVLADGVLHIVETSFLRKREHTIPRDEIATISVGAAVGSKGWQLLIATNDRHVIRLLAWRDRDELRKIAEQLYDGLRLGTDTQDRAAG